MIAVRTQNTTQCAPYSPKGRKSSFSFVITITVLFANAIYKWNLKFSVIIFSRFYIVTLFPFRKLWGDSMSIKRIPYIREFKKQLVMKYASNCIKIHSVGLLPVAVCTHMNDSIVWDRALCCSVPVYKATLILHKYLTAFWDVWDFFFFFKVMFHFSFSISTPWMCVAVTIGKHSCVTSVNLIKLGKGKREGKMDSLKINKISPIFSLLTMQQQQHKTWFQAGTSLIFYLFWLFNDFVISVTYLWTTCMPPWRYPDIRCQLRMWCRYIYLHVCVRCFNHT